MYETIKQEAMAAAREICQAAKLRRGQILVVGCSTSEVTGHKVGSDSSPAIGQAIYEGIQAVLAPQGIYLAAQCCEHLNRATILEAEAADSQEICNVVPQPKAGAPSPRRPTTASGIPWPWRRSGPTPGWTSAAPSSDAPEEGGRPRPPGAEARRPGHRPGGPGAAQVHRRRAGRVRREPEITPRRPLFTNWSRNSQFVHRIPILLSQLSRIL